MTQADSVHSTPPTNTSVLYENSSRRGFLAQAAAVTAAGGALGMTLPLLPVSAGAPKFVPDPIYAIIEKHRELSARYDAAVGVSGNLEEGPEFDAADDITAAACKDLLDFADSLVCSQPTTLAGVIALLRYAASMQEWELPRDRKISDENGDRADWTRAFFATVAKALDQIGAQA